MSSLTELFQSFKPVPLVNQLKEFIQSAKDEELFHINLYRLADQWKIPRRDLLDLSIRAVGFSIFELQWEFHCPECGGVARESLSLGETRADDYCPVCNVGFKNTLDQNIEVFFNISPSIKKLSAEHSENYKKTVVHDITNHHLFDWRNSYTITGTDCINNPVFLELFGEDSLPLDQSLEIKSATILFTDIKGSTALYERLGDARAYKLVRDHFKILFEEIIRQNGVPIKTIGDAVMGVFSAESDGIKAALESQKRLIDYYSGKPAEERIEVKIGLHSGSTLVVTLNGRLDYFGSTVNRAARIQGMAEPNEVVFSEELLKKIKNIEAIKGCTNTLLKSKVQLKGLPDPMIIYRASCKT